MSGGCNKGYPCGVNFSVDVKDRKNAEALGPALHEASRQRINGVELDDWDKPRPNKEKNVCTRQKFHSRFVPDRNNPHKGLFGWSREFYLMCPNHGRFRALRTGRRAKSTKKEVTEYSTRSAQFVFVRDSSVGEGSNKKGMIT